MSFRSYIEKIEKENKIQKFSKTVSKKFEAAAILNGLGEKPVLFEKIKESEFKVCGNIFASKQSIAEYFGISTEAIIPKMIKALASPSKPKIVPSAPCHEIEMEVDLDKLPILFHCEKDGGNYISSGIIFAKDKELGQNASFHRAMQISKNKLVLRILQRDLDALIKKNAGELDVTMAIGNSPNVLLAAATSTALGKDEMEIANSLEPLTVVKSKTNDVMIPAESEFVLEGRITKELHSEGPFVDLTETYDIVREQQVFEVKKIFHRKNPIWQALLPGKLEHKLLMGMPREPTIYEEVNKTGVKCKNVYINPGGCSWLHAIVQIEKNSEDDGKKAIEAAFKGHASLKHVFVIDTDINILDPLEVEWAIATRFQADRDLLIKTHEKGSSLDPSSDPNTRETTKAGFDLTKPLVIKGKNFEKAIFPKVDLKKFY